jgi:hypothetical protein
MKCDDVLNANDSKWRAEARLLMEQGKHFVVVEWRFPFDERNSVALAQEFDYSVKFDHTKDQAFFAPKSSV